VGKDKRKESRGILSHLDANRETSSSSGEDSGTFERGAVIDVEDLERSSDESTKVKSHGMGEGREAGGKKEREKRVSARKSDVD